MLVVDDAAMVRENLGLVLGEEGYAVDLAADGATALSAARATRPDAILLDLMMPGMNGRQVLQALRDDPELRRVPVLMMTAVHGANLSSLGDIEVLEKPFDVDDMLNKVALAVYRGADEEEPRAAPAAAPPPPPAEPAVVLVVESDRARLQQLDQRLSSLGYTVVSMTRALAQLARLARALRPRAILLDVGGERGDELLAQLRGEQVLANMPVLAFARDGRAPAAPGAPSFLPGATDAELVRFVESQG